MKLLILSTLVLYIGATNPEPRIMPGCKKVGDHWICPTPKPDQIPENCHKLGRPGPPGPFGPPEGVRCVCNEVHNRLMCPDITKNNEVDNCVLRKEGNINFIFCDIKQNSKDATSNASITKSTKPPTTEPPKMNCKEGKTFILCENYVCKRRGKKLRCPTLPKNVDRQKCEKFDNTMVCPIKKSTPTTTESTTTTKPKTTTSNGEPSSNKCHLENGIYVCLCQKEKKISSCPKLPKNVDKPKCVWHGKIYACPVKSN